MTQKQLAAAQEELSVTKQRLEKLTADSEQQQRQLRNDLSIAKVLFSLFERGNLQITYFLT